MTRVLCSNCWNNCFLMYKSSRMSLRLVADGSSALCLAFEKSDRVGAVGRRPSGGRDAAHRLAGIQNRA